MQSVVTLILGIGTVVALYVREFFKGLKQVNYISGHRCLISPISLIGSIIPTCFWHRGVRWSWIYRETAYFNYSHDIISIVPVLVGHPHLFTCSLDVLKQLVGNEHKTHLFKMPDMTTFTYDDVDECQILFNADSFVRVWGHSVASANGELWRRHKRAINPAFRGSMHVETSQVYQELLDNEGWGGQNSVFVPNIKEVLKTTFLVILGRCGFGIPMEWPKKEEKIDLSAEMPLTQAIEISATTFIARLMLPEWAYKLPIKNVRVVKKAWDTMFNKTGQIIRDRRSATIKDGADEGGHILRSLIESAIDESGNYLLDEHETAANMFTMFFAGHETTSSVITATFGFLAIYQDEQEKAYQEVLAFISKNGRIGIKDMETMPHLSACIFEAGRRYPAAFFVPRALTEDTVVKIKHPVEKTIVLPKGVRMIFDLIAIFNNPIDFPEPHVFRPSRWYGVSDSDVFSFSVGPRACPGRKFALIEGLNLLAHFLQEWKFDVVLNPGETREAYERRVMDEASPDATAFSVGKISLKLTRRAALE